MRLKSLALCSTSVAILAYAAPVTAQTTPPPPSAAPRPADQTQPAEEVSPAPPLGTPQDPIAAATLPPVTDAPNAGEIVVTGLRQSEASAQAIKRQSDGIVDAIVADDIGKLPDITASAALARIPGVQVTRNNGVAQDVRIRGLPDISTTYNGRTIFTGEGRFVQIQDFPAAQVAALEVFKSSTANLIEPGLGGQVNVRGRRPFDFKGLQVFASANGLLFDQAQELAYNANLLVSNRWETGIGEIGVLVSAFYGETDFLDSQREAAQFIEAQPNRLSPQFRYPDSVGIFYMRGDRWRPSGSAVVQWKPTPDLEIYADGLYQGYRGRDFASSHQTPLFRVTPQSPLPTFSNVVLEEGSNRVKSATVTNARSPRGFAGSSDAKTNTYQAAAGFIWTPENVRVTGDVAYSYSRYNEQILNIDYFLGTQPVVDVDFNTDIADGGPTFNWRNVDSTDPNNYYFRGLFDRSFVQRGDDIQGRLDGEYDTQIDFLKRIQVGLRFNERNASYRNGERFNDTGPAGLFENRRIPFSALPVDLELTDVGFRYNDAQQLRLFVRPERDSMRANADPLRALVAGLNPAGPFAAGAPPRNPLQAFDALERGYTTYGQLKYEFDLGGILIDGLGGLRIVRTETTVTGTSRIETPNPAGGAAIVTFTPVDQTITRDDFLPNVSARIELQPELQLRLAYTQTRTLPGFGQLNPSSTVSAIGGDLFQNINSGNPNLRALESNNYDASLEYYFTRTGSATLSVYRRDVNGFISNVQTIVYNDPNNQSLGGQRFNRPENGGDGRLQGFEVGFNTFFDLEILPQWARAFGFRTNFTYNDATSALPFGNPPGPQDLGVQLPGQQPLGGVSEYSYNIVGLYETSKISARLAYNYRSDYVNFYRNVANAPPAGAPAGSPPFELDRPEIHEGLGILDFSATVTPIPNITLAFDVSNILGASRRFTNPYTLEGDSFPLSRRYIERVFSLGFRFRL